MNWCTDNSGDFIQPAAQARQLVWNRGAGLQRDCPILQVCCTSADCVAMLHPCISKACNDAHVYSQTRMFMRFCSPVAECHTGAHPRGRTRSALDAHVDTWIGLWHCTGRSLLHLAASKQWCPALHGTWLGWVAICMLCMYAARHMAVRCRCCQHYVAVDQLLAALVCRPNCKGFLVLILALQHLCSVIGRQRQRRAPN